MTPQERKAKVLELRKEHEDYFQTSGNINALYIPKMAYRPSGKDELHISFFPSELQKINDVTDRSKVKEHINVCPEIINPDKRTYIDVLTGIERALLSINQKLSK